LKVINKSYQNTRKIPKVTAKIHINNIYERKLSRFDQVKRIVDLLGFIPRDFHISIVGNYNYRDFENSYYDNFLEKCYLSFGIKFFFIETFPSNEKNILKIIDTKKCFGCSFPQNIFFISYLTKDFNRIPYFSYSILGNPNWWINYFSKKQKNYLNYLYKIEGKNAIDLNLEYFLSKAKNKNHLYGVTNCKNIIQYNDLIHKISRLIEIKNNKQVSHYYFKDFKYYSFPDKIISRSPYRIFKNIRDYKYMSKCLIVLIKKILGFGFLNKKWI
jgi:hypothetical protein